MLYVVKPSRARIRETVFKWMLLGITVAFSACAAPSNDSVADEAAAQQTLPGGCVTHPVIDANDYPPSLWQPYRGAEPLDNAYEERVRRAAQSLKTEIWDLRLSLDQVITTQQMEQALLHAFCNIATAQQLRDANEQGFVFSNEAPSETTASDVSEQDIRAWETLHEVFRSNESVHRTALRPLGVPDPNEDLVVHKSVLGTDESNPALVLTNNGRTRIAGYTPLQPIRHEDALKSLAELITLAKRGARPGDDYALFANNLLSDIAYLSANWMPFGSLGSNWDVLFILYAQARAERFRARIYNTARLRPSTGLDSIMKWTAMSHRDAHYLYRYWASGAFDQLFYSRAGEPLRSSGGSTWAPSEQAQQLYNEHFHYLFATTFDRIATLIEDTQSTGSTTGEEHIKASQLMSVSNRLMQMLVIPDNGIARDDVTLMDEMGCLLLGHSTTLLAGFLDKRDALLATAQGSSAIYVKHMYGTALTTFNGYALQAATRLEQTVGCHSEIATYRYLANERINK